MIRSKLREPESSQQEEALFSDTGIFGSFRQKIWTAYFLKWIGPLTRRDLDLVRSIRNIVAHNMNPVSFDTPEIANRCSELFVAKNSVPAQQRPTDLRGMLMLTPIGNTAGLRVPLMGVIHSFMGNQADGHS